MPCARHMRTDTHQTVAGCSTACLQLRAEPAHQNSRPTLADHLWDREGWCSGGAPNAVYRLHVLYNSAQGTSLHEPLAFASSTGWQRMCGQLAA